MNKQYENKKKKKICISETAQDYIKWMVNKQNGSHLPAY